MLRNDGLGIDNEEAVNLFCDSTQFPVLFAEDTTFVITEVDGIASFDQI